MKDAHTMDGSDSRSWKARLEDVKRIKRALGSMKDHNTRQPHTVRSQQQCCQR